MSTPLKWLLFSGSELLNLMLFGPALAVVVILAKAGLLPVVVF